VLELPKQLLLLTHLNMLCRPAGNAASLQALPLSHGLLPSSSRECRARTPWARRARLRCGAQSTC
jgi:hypothetical protein